jgi:hypothetical protein
MEESLRGGKNMVIYKWSIPNNWGLSEGWDCVLWLAYGIIIEDSAVAYIFRKQFFIPQKDTLRKFIRGKDYEV